MRITKRFDYITFSPPDEGGAAGASAPSGASPSGAEGTAVSGESSVPGESSPGSEFDGLGDFDEVTIEQPTSAPAASTTPSSPPSLTPSPTATPAAPTPSVAAPPTSQAPPVQPEAAASPAPQEQPAQAGAPASLPADAASLLREFEANQAGIVDLLAADGRFQLSSDEALMLETDPGKAVPRLLARTYYMAVNATLAHINNLVPGMIHRQVEGQRIQREREDRLYSMFKALDRTKHHPDVMSFAQIFRAQNPALKFEELAPLVGAAVMAKHGLTAMPPGAPNGASSPKPVVQSPPFVPARPGVSVTTTPVEESPYAGLGQEWPD